MFTNGGSCFHNGSNKTVFMNPLRNSTFSPTVPLPTPPAQVFRNNNNSPISLNSSNSSPEPCSMYVPNLPSLVDYCYSVDNGVSGIYNYVANFSAYYQEELNSSSRINTYSNVGQTDSRPASPEIRTYLDLSSCNRKTFNRMSPDPFKQGSACNWGAPNMVTCLHTNSMNNLLPNRDNSQYFHERIDRPFSGKRLQTAFGCDSEKTQFSNSSIGKDFFSNRNTDQEAAKLISVSSNSKSSSPIDIQNISTLEDKGKQQISTPTQGEGVVTENNLAKSETETQQNQQSNELVVSLPGGATLFSVPFKPPVKRKRGRPPKKQEKPKVRKTAENKKEPKPKSKPTPRYKRGGSHLQLRQNTPHLNPVISNRSLHRTNTEPVTVTVSDSESEPHPGPSNAKSKSTTENSEIQFIGTFPRGTTKVNTRPQGNQEERAKSSAEHVSNNNCNSSSEANGRKDITTEKPQHDVANSKEKANEKDIIEVQVVEKNPSHDTPLDNNCNNGGDKHVLEGSTDMQPSKRSRSVSTQTAMSISNETQSNQDIGNTTTQDNKGNNGKMSNLCNILPMQAGTEPSAKRMRNSRKKGKNSTLGSYAKNVKTKNAKLKKKACTEKESKIQNPTRHNERNLHEENKADDAMSKFAIGIIQNSENEKCMHPETQNSNNGSKAIIQQSCLDMPNVFEMMGAESIKTGGTNKDDKILNNEMENMQLSSSATADREITTTTTTKQRNQDQPTMEKGAENQLLSDLYMQLTISDDSDEDSDAGCNVDVRKSLTNAESDSSIPRLKGKQAPNTEKCNVQRKEERIMLCQVSPPQSQTDKPCQTKSVLTDVCDGKRDEMPPENPEIALLCSTVTPIDVSHSPSNASTLPKGTTSPSVVQRADADNNPAFDTNAKSFVREEGKAVAAITTIEHEFAHEQLTDSPHPPISIAQNTKFTSETKNTGPLMNPNSKPNGSKPMENTKEGNKICSTFAERGARKRMAHATKSHITASQIPTNSSVIERPAKKMANSRCESRPRINPMIRKLIKFSKNHKAHKSGINETKTKLNADLDKVFVLGNIPPQRKLANKSKINEIVLEIPGPMERRPRVPRPKPNKKTVSKTHDINIIKNKISRIGQESMLSARSSARPLKRQINLSDSDNDESTLVNTVVSNCISQRKQEISHKGLCLSDAEESGEDDLDILDLHAERDSSIDMLS